MSELDELVILGNCEDFKDDEISDLLNTYYDISYPETIEYFLKLIKKDDIRFKIFLKCYKKLSSHQIISVALTFQNDIFKCKIIEIIAKETSLNPSLIYILVTHIKDNKTKQIYLNLLSPIYKYLLLEELDLNSLPSTSINEKDILTLVKEFSSLTTEEKDFVLVHIKNKKLLDILLNQINDESIKDFIKSNVQTPEISSTEIKESVSKAKIDPRITIGVELEVCHPNIRKYSGLKKVMQDYKIVKDGSVKSGFEIVSPILHFNESDLNKLNSLCEMLSRGGFYTDDTCGGHIHIGASILDSFEDYYMLIYLFTNCENILYKICDRENSQKRRKTGDFCQKVKDCYLNALETGYLKTPETFEEFALILNCIHETRYRGLNFRNILPDGINTIEFRMPNGEEEFKELLANITLFAKLIQTSHELTHLENESDKKRMAKSISYTQDEKERLELLMNILFDSEEERQIYYDRYTSNTLVEELVDGVVVKPDEVLIGYDEAKRVLVKKEMNMN